MCAACTCISRSTGSSPISSAAPRCCRVEGHAIGGKSVGYKTCDAPLSLEYALQALYDEQIRPAIAQGLSAAVYTQLSDVEHELNGLVTYDRSIVKLPVKTLHKIFYIENE